LRREDPSFVPPSSAHAKNLNEFNSKFMNGVSLSEKRLREDDGTDRRQSKREKLDEDEEEMEIEDDEDAKPPSKGKSHSFFLPSLLV
jgi:hypothetical protein